VHPAAAVRHRCRPARAPTPCPGLRIAGDEQVLDELGANSEFDLLGLFQGVGLPRTATYYEALRPSMGADTAA
jgi:hypothetical protein